MVIDMDMSSKNLEPAKIIEKVEYAVNALRVFIIDGNLKPGTELPPESEMAKQIGVSKFTMREALRVLQAQGLIDIAQGRRTKVADLSPGPAIRIMSYALSRSKSALSDLTEARQILESGIAWFAATRAEPAQIEALRKTISDMENNRYNLEVCVERDVGFHNILMQASKNPVFEIMSAPLTELLRKSRKETLRTTGADRAIEGHKLILAAVIERDSEKAAKAMRLHLQMAAEDLKKAEADK